MGLAVPEEAFIHHGHLVGRSAPFAHENGAGSRQRARWRLGRVGRVVTKHTCQQPVEFLGDRSGEPAVAPFLPRIGNSERKNISSQRRRRRAGKFPLPEYAQFSTRLLLQVVDLDTHITIVMHWFPASMVGWHRR